MDHALPLLEFAVAVVHKEAARGQDEVGPADILRVFVGERSRRDDGPVSFSGQPWADASRVLASSGKVLDESLMRP